MPSPPAWWTTSPIQWSRPSPLSSTTFASAVRSTSAGRGSYSCGSVFGRSSWCTVDARRRRRRAPSRAIGSSSRRPCGARSRPARAAAAGASATAPSAASAAAAAAAAHARAADRDQREHGAREHGDRRARAARRSRPTATARRRPRRAASPTVASCHGAQPVARRAAWSPPGRPAARWPAARRPPPAPRRRPARRAPSSSGVGQRASAGRARAPRPGRTRAPATRGRAASGASDGDRAAGGERHVAVVDQQQAAEQQRVDARAGVEDVAREHAPRAPARRRGRSPSAVVPLRAAPRASASSRAANSTAAPNAPERRREAEAVRQHQAGERRRADRVRVEGEPAEHDPRPDDARPRREQQRSRPRPRWTNWSVNGCEHRAGGYRKRD